MKIIHQRKYLSGKTTYYYGEERRKKTAMRMTEKTAAVHEDNL